MATLGSRRRCRGLALPRATRRVGHRRTVASSTAAAGGVARGRSRYRRLDRRGAPRRRARHPLVPRRRPRRAEDARRHAARGRAPGVARPEDVGAPPVRERRDGARARGARRDDDQRLDRPLGAGARRAPRGVLRAARRLRRGAGRPGRLRALLRRAGDRPARRARLREARAAQRAEHLSRRDSTSRSSR